MHDIVYFTPDIKFRTRYVVQKHQTYNLNQQNKCIIVLSDYELLCYNIILLVLISYNKLYRSDKLIL